MAYGLKACSCHPLSINIIIDYYEFLIIRLSTKIYRQKIL